MRCAPRTDSLAASPRLQGGSMRRREFIALVGGAAAWPLGLLAQSQTAKRVGVLSPFQPLAGPTHAFDAFKQRMRELEWLDGQNVVFEYRWAEGRADRLPNLASELAGLKLDVFFSAWGTPAALAAKNATTTVPIVFAGVGDAVGVRLVESLARPGGNVTGSTFISEETIAKQLELLKEVVPTSSRMGILVNPSNPVYGPVLKASEVPAKALGVQLQALDVQGQSDFQIAFDSAASAQVGGLVVMRDPIFQINKLWLVELAAKRRLPVI